MSPGTHYHPVLGDSHADPSHVKKVMLCSGKHFYELDKQRKKRGINDVAIVRLEVRDCYIKSTKCKASKL